MPARRAVSRDLERDLRRDLRRTQAQARLPSVSAAVFSRGDVVWSDAVGLAHVTGEERATTDHQYRVGSITKTFTAAAIMQLRDAGEVHLEDPLERHLPQAAGAGAPTVRRLLSHLAGLQRAVPGELWETLEFPDRDGLLAAYARADRVAAPGAHWHYSNLAFALLGQLVEARSGVPYERFVEQRLLQPVGLTRTTWEERSPAARAYFVEPFEDTVREEPHVDLRAVRAAGQLWSTVGDLARWASFLADPDPDVLRPESAAEMRAFQSLADHERWTRGYGLGLELQRSGDRVFFGHTGGMPGFVSAVFCSAAERVGATALTNASQGDRVIDLAIRLAETVADQPADDVDEWRPGAPAPPELASLLGSWWSDADEWVFALRDGHLEARLRDGASTPPAVFAPDGDDRFRVASGPERGELLRVVRDGAGDPVKLYWATYAFTRRPVPRRAG